LLIRRGLSLKSLLILFYTQADDREAQPARRQPTGAPLQTMSTEEMNAMAADIMRAELMGDEVCGSL
jgi:hypothetical protein